MKNFLTFLLFMPILVFGQNSVGIGTLTPNSKSVLELVSSPANTQGLLLPRVTTLPTGYGATETGMAVYMGANLRVWNGTSWNTYPNAASATTFWDLSGQITNPTNGAKDVNVNTGWLATNTNLYVGTGFGSPGTLGPGLFVGGSEINLGKANGNKINLLDGFNKRISVDADHLTFNNQENSGTTGTTISSFLLNNTAASRFRVGTAARPQLFTVLTNTGYVGIGTGAPAQNLVIKDTTATDANANISLISGTDGSTILYMGDNNNLYIASMGYDNSTNIMSWRTNNGIRMLLSSAGRLSVGTSASDWARLNVGNSSVRGVGHSAQFRANTEGFGLSATDSCLATIGISSNATFFVGLDVRARRVITNTYTPSGIALDLQYNTNNGTAADRGPYLRLNNSYGVSNMVAIAYGNIQATGTINAGATTDNVTTVTNPSAGVYHITIANESFFWQWYTTIATLNGGIGFISTGSVSNKLIVSTYNSAGAPTNQAFNFVIYKK